MNIPWESCITVGHSFAFGFDDQYKSGRQLAHILLEVVSKGGNLALNVGPQPDGRLPKGAIRGIQGLGEWLNTHGEGIYGTRICAPYYTKEWAFTQKEEINTVYAFRMYRNESETLEERLIIPYVEKVERVELIGTNDVLSFQQTQEGLLVELPRSATSNQAPITHTFRLITKS